MKIEEKDIKILIIFVVVALLIFAYSTFINKNSDLEQAQRKLAQNEERYKYWKTKVGSTSILKSRPNETIKYLLHTFDDGATWYAAEQDKDNKMKILGKANDVYPGILEHIDIIDKLVDKSKSDTSLGEDIRVDLRKKENHELLRKIGFEVMEASKN